MYSRASWRARARDPDRRRTGTIAGTVPRTIALSNARPLQHYEHVALCFLTRGPLPLRDLWEPWFRHPQVHAIIHPKDPSLVPEDLRGLITSRVLPTEWGEPTIVDAMMQLLSDALQRFPRAQHFQFLSETCAPVVSSQTFINTMRYLVSRVPTGRVRVPGWFGTAQWSCLSRTHAEHLVAHWGEVMDLAVSTPRGLIPDEVAIATFLHRRPDPHGGTLVDMLTTYVEFPDPAIPHPTTWPDVTPALAKQAHGRNCMFVRKVVRPPSSRHAQS